MNKTIISLEVFRKISNNTNINNLLIASINYSPLKPLVIKLFHNFANVITKRPWAHPRHLGNIYITYQSTYNFQMINVKLSRHYHLCVLIRHCVGSIHRLLFYLGPCSKRFDFFVCYSRPEVNSPTVIPLAMLYWRDEASPSDVLSRLYTKDQRTLVRD